MEVLLEEGPDSLVQPVNAPSAVACTLYGDEDRVHSGFFQGFVENHGLAIGDHGIGRAVDDQERGVVFGHVGDWIGRGSSFRNGLEWRAQ